MRVWNLPIIEVMSFADIEEDRDTALVVSKEAYDAVSDRILFRTASCVSVDRAIEAEWRSLANEVHGEVIYAVGGGVAVDAAKFIGSVKAMPVVSLPTAMTVDAFFTWASGVREDGCVRYIETGPPERVVIDLDVLGQAPGSLRAAGICDLLSIATGSWDWRYARDSDQLDSATAYQTWVDKMAMSILDAAIDCSEAAGRGDPDGLKQLIDCLALEVQLCNQIGHSRPEEGSEHYFAYAAESLVDRALPHGDLVGPGILVAAHLQKQDLAPLRQALNEARVPLTSLPGSVIDQTVQSLSEYVANHGLPYGIAHDFTASSTDYADILL